MATSQMYRPQQRTSNWSTVFPADQVTRQQSALFVKKLLAVAISNITYLRTIFPEHAFGDRCLEDLNLKILRDNSACLGACQVIQWVKGCFDALDKKYLRMIVMAIYKDEKEPNNIVESYTFKFSYSEGDDSSISIFRNGSKITSATCPSETRKATIKLLRTIVVLTQTLRPLPDDVIMTMKLFYYDENTPLDYEPPGFEPTSEGEFTFSEKPMNIKVGDVSTPFHAVKLRIKTDCQQIVLKEEDIDSSIEQSISVGNKTTSQSVVQTAEATTSTTAVEPTVEQTASEGPTPPLTGTQPPIEDGVTVRCPCSYNEDEGLMILCDICNYWQHSACFGLRNQEEVPELHVCELCANKSFDKHCTDPGLLKMSGTEAQSHCLWRRTLLNCLQMNSVISHALAKRMNIEVNVAQGLVNRLEKEGLVQQSTKRGRHWKVVLKDVIEAIAMKKYFLSSSDGATPLQSKQEDCVEQLATKTSSLNLLPQQIKTQLTTFNEEQKEHVRRSPRIAKRARSIVDPSVEFEISDSQDFESTQEVGNKRKRRKVSIASKSILV